MSFHSGGKIIQGVKLQDTHENLSCILRYCFASTVGAGITSYGNDFPALCLPDTHKAKRGCFTLHRS